jgi:hypothetical protein
MRAATVRNLFADTLSLPSLTNGNSFGLLRAPNGLPFPYLLPLRKKPTGFGLGLHGAEKIARSS